MMNSIHEHQTNASHSHRFLDALVANFAVDDIQGHLIHLKWSVLLPRGAPKCYVEVIHCKVASKCTTTIISDMTDRLAHLEIEPFEKYNITMKTTCMFVPGIVVSGLSESLDVLAAAREFPVL